MVEVSISFSGGTIKTGTDTSDTLSSGITVQSIGGGGGSGGTNGGLSQ